jgi:hypothetical protein
MGTNYGLILINYVQFCILMTFSHVHFFVFHKKLNTFFRFIIHSKFFPDFLLERII